MRQEIKTSLAFGIIIAVAVVAVSQLLAQLDEQAPAVPIGAPAPGSPQPVDKSGLREAPGLVGIFEHINTTPEALAEEMEGKVVLYDIWTYSCINCIRTLPYITAWDDKYADQGLLIVGVHSPEFEFEKDPGNVRAAVEKHGIRYPVVMDNDMETWKAFENRYWPRKYVADHEGYIRYDKIGEGGYDETERVIQGLLEERAAALGLQAASAETLVDIDEFEHTLLRTPELYFGYEFAFGRDRLGSPEGFRPGSVVDYAAPGQLELHSFYMEGEWRNGPESMELVSEEGSIHLQYSAKEVNIVTEGAAELAVYLDGGPVPDGVAGSAVSGGRVSASEPDLYNLVDSGSAHTAYMRIDVSGPGFQIFTFTFG